MDSHISELAVADGGVIYAHMRVETRQTAFFKKQIFAVVGCENAPEFAVIDVVCLPAVYEMYVYRVIGAQIIGAHRDRGVCRTSSHICSVAGEDAIRNGDICGEFYAGEGFVRCAVVEFADYLVC